MPDPAKILPILQRAAMLLRATPGREGSVIRLDGLDDVLVVGDLHGHLHAFSWALKLADLAGHPRRHFVVQELVHDTRIDPDEGQVDLSHRLVDLVCALKCQYPGRVHWLLGNHELSELTGRSIAKKGFALNGLFRKGVEQTYGAGAAEGLMAAYRELFAALPVVLQTPNRVFIGHTLPDAKDFDRLDREALKAPRWPEEATARGGTIYALTWGRDTSRENADRFAEWIDADLFVTGHQPCEDGFRAANHRQLILDGTDPFPACCLFDAKEPATLERLLEGVRLLRPSE